jgi:hypothetical protein
MAMELNATRFPFPLPPRTIGEQKAKVKNFFFVAQALLPVLFLGLIHLGKSKTEQTRTGRSACATCARSTTANLLVLPPGQLLRDCFRYICGYVLLRQNLLPSDRRIRLARTAGRFEPGSGWRFAM